MDADFIFTDSLLGIMCAVTGRSQEGIAILERTADQTGRSPFYVGLLGFALGLAGRRAEAERTLEELAARQADGYVPPLSNAFVYSGLGEPDRAFEWLDKAIEDGSWILPHAPALRRLRPDPRFRQAMKRLGL